MNNWIKPNIVISKCLNNNPCRYNGEAANSKLISKLSPFINLIEICPEEEIGLKTPRNPIRLVQSNGSICLLEPKTLKDHTLSMNEFSSKSCTILKEKNPHGFIFKNKSPSCAVSDAPIYTNSSKEACILKKSSGFYTNHINSYFTKLPIEDEGRLSNFSIRDQFFTRIFTLSHFYSLKNELKINLLIEFHTKNKFLFMSYNQTTTKQLGKILASYGTLDFKSIFSLYESNLLELLSKKPKYTSMINVFMHIYSHFSNMLRTNEKKYFFDLVDKYRLGLCPHSIIINTLKGYAIRFSDKYLLNQTLLNAYPDELVDFSDSGKGIVR
ncbi:MAG: YbgA family protein [Clostridium sp.]